MNRPTGSMSIRPVEPAGPRYRWAAVLLPVLFFGWMYGSALLFLLGLLNDLGARSVDGYPRNGWYYAAGLMVAFTGSLTGLGIAGAVGRYGWRRWFGVAVSCSLLALLAVGVGWTAGYQPATPPGPVPALVPERPAEEEPAQPGPATTHCVNFSGGEAECPGG